MAEKILPWGNLLPSEKNALIKKLQETIKEMQGKMFRQRGEIVVYGRELLMHGEIIDKNVERLDKLEPAFVEHLQEYEDNGDVGDPPDPTTPVANIPERAPATRETAGGAVGPVGLGHGDGKSCGTCAVFKPGSTSHPGRGNCGKGRGAVKPDSVYGNCYVPRSCGNCANQLPQRYYKCTDNDVEVCPDWIPKKEKDSPPPHDAGLDVISDSCLYCGSKHVQCMKCKYPGFISEFHNGNRTTLVKTGPGLWVNPNAKPGMVAEATDILKKVGDGKSCGTKTCGTCILWSLNDDNDGWCSKYEAGVDVDYTAAPCSFYVARSCGTCVHGKPAKNDEKHRYGCDIHSGIVIHIFQYCDKHVARSCDNCKHNNGISECWRLRGLKACEKWEPREGVETEGVSTKDSPPPNVPKANHEASAPAINRPRELSHSRTGDGKGGELDYPPADFVPDAAWINEKVDVQRENERLRQQLADANQQIESIMKVSLVQQIKDEQERNVHLTEKVAALEKELTSYNQVNDRTSKILGEVVYCPFVDEGDYPDGCFQCGESTSDKAICARDKVKELEQELTTVKKEEDRLRRELARVKVERNKAEKELVALKKERDDKLIGADETLLPGYFGITMDNDNERARVARQKEIGDAFDKADSWDLYKDFIQRVRDDDGILYYSDDPDYIKCPKCQKWKYIGKPVKKLIDWGDRRECSCKEENHDDIL